MKTFIALFALVAVSQASPQWENFKLEHNKLYANPIEERTRFAIFQQNLKEIEEHNKLYEAGLVSWQQGITPFTDWTKEEFISYLSQSGEEQGPSNATPFIPDPSVQAPAKKNWVTEGKVSEVKNQASCGSCWSFAATGAIESQLLMKGQNTLLSEQQLVDCSTENHGCSGGLASKAFDYIKVKGIETESDYPYTARNGNCQYDATKAKVKVSGYSEAHDEKLIVDLVGTKGPTAVSIDGTHIQNYKSGVFDSTACTMTTNHAVLVVGYDNEDGKDYWLVKNSWGANWGEKGYIKMVRGKNMCNIAKRAYVPTL